MQIILASDHGGFAAKQALKPWLQEAGYEVFDAGNTTYTADDDFPDFVAAAIQLHHAHPDSRLVLWCRSGVGMAIAANRHPGIYCGQAFLPDQVMAATRDNHLNALALSAEYLSLDEQKALLQVFLATTYDLAPRFARRLTKLDQSTRKPS